MIGNLRLYLDDAAAPGNTDGGGAPVDQGGMADAFLEQETGFEGLDQLDAQDMEPEQTEKPKTNEPAKTEPANAAQPTTEKPKTTEAVKRSALDSDFFKADGTIDQEKYFQSFDPAKAFKTEPFKPQPPAAPVAKTADDVPAWKKAFQEKQSLRKTIVQQHGRANQFIREAIKTHGANAFQTVEHALAYGEQMVQSELNQHFAEMDAEEQAKALADKEAMIPNAQKQAETRSASVSNESAMINSLFPGDAKGAEKYQELVFGNNFAGPFVVDLYHASKPDAEKLPHDQWLSGLKEFWTGFSANKNNLTRVVKLGQALWQNSLTPHMKKHLEGVVKKEAIDRSKANLGKAAGGAQVGPQPGAKTAADPVGSYFGRAPGGKKQLATV